MMPPRMGIDSTSPTRKPAMSSIRLTTVQTTVTTSLVMVKRTMHTTLTRTQTSQQKTLFRHSIHQLQGSSRQRLSHRFSHLSIGCSTWVSIQVSTSRNVRPTGASVMKLLHVECGKNNS